AAHPASRIQRVSGQASGQTHSPIESSANQHRSCSPGDRADLHNFAGGFSGSQTDTGTISRGTGKNDCSRMSSPFLFWVFGTRKEMTALIMPSCKVNKER